MTEASRNNMNSSSEFDGNSLQEFDLRELFLVLWSRKEFLTFVTLIFTIGSVIYALMLTDIYRSESILISSKSQSSSSLSQYSGLASLAGVNFPENDGDGITEILTIIKSRDFVKHLMTFDDILPSIMAAESYNPITKQINFDPEIYDAEKRTWINSSYKNQKNGPSYLETHNYYISNMLTITEDQKTGLVSIYIEHLSPVFAQNFLKLVIKEANKLKREKDIRISDEALGFLRLELADTSLVAIKESISNLVEAQLERKMMASIQEDYILSTIEPPFIPEEKYKPVRAVIVIIGTILGSLVGFLITIFQFYILGRHSVKKNS